MSNMKGFKKFNQLTLDVLLAKENLVASYVNLETSDSDASYRSSLNKYTRLSNHYGRLLSLVEKGNFDLNDF